MPLINGKFEPLELPPKHARVLFDNTKKWRIRCLHGGRSGAKDWSMTAAIIERAVRKSTRVLCTREIQNTIKDSTHRLLSDTIKRLGYEQYFRVLDNEIRCNVNDSIFAFRGLRDLNADNIKSIEGIDVCMIGEAQNLTKKSFTILNPTIRKPGSEIWIQYNPQFDDDFIYDLTVVNPPNNLICEQVLYTDNPWNSQEIIDQAERMKREDELLYRNVWLGEPLGQGGRVFPMYNPDIHEIDFDLAMLPQCNLYMAIDPHRKYYPAIKWYAVTPTSAVVVYNEWPKYEDLGMWYDEARNTKQFDIDLKELANIILGNDMTFQYPGCSPVKRCGDPRFLNENPDLQRVLMENGVIGWVDAPFEKIETQRENLKVLINYNPALPLCGINTPDWYIKRECRNSCRAYKRHCWSEDKDKEREDNKDFIDVDRYFLSIVNGKPLYEEPYKPKVGGQLISLATHQLSQLPTTNRGINSKGNKR